KHLEQVGHGHVIPGHGPLLHVRVVVGVVWLRYPTIHRRQKGLIAGSNRKPDRRPGEVVEMRRRTIKCASAAIGSTAEVVASQIEELPRGGEATIRISRVGAAVVDR